MQHVRYMGGARAAVLLATLLAASAGCTELKTLSHQQVLDKADAGSDGGGIVIPTNPDSDKLCILPEIPPRVPAVFEGEEVCSKGSAAWPDCVPDQCDAPDFATACKQLCEMTCERERWFCTRSHCEAPKDETLTYCDTPAAMQECMDTCAGDPTCLNMACQEKREVRCQEMTCLEPGSSPSCGGLTCNNSCGTSLDGECSDGSPINSTGDSCTEGSDCADCGARAACFELGAECFATVHCCGFEKGDAHCADVSRAGETPLGRCLQDCTGNAGCPDGFRCTALEGGSSACFPLCSFASP